MKQSDEKSSSAQIPFLTKNEGENEDNPSLSLAKNHQNEGEEGNMKSSLETKTSKVESGVEDVLIESDQKSHDSSKTNIKGIEIFHKICPKFCVICNFHFKREFKLQGVTRIPGIVPSKSNIFI